MKLFGGWTKIAVLSLVAGLLASLEILPHVRPFFENDLGMSGAASLALGLATGPLFLASVALGWISVFLVVGPKRVGAGLVLVWVAIQMGVFLGIAQRTSYSNGWVTIALIVSPLLAAGLIVPLWWALRWLFGVVGGPDGTRGL